jgi:low affinity Fe/Cu permease
VHWRDSSGVGSAVEGSPSGSRIGKHFKEFLTQAGTWLARPWAFGLVAVYVVLWFYFERNTFGWHGIATVATLFMTLFIQRSEHRDTQAIHAKLDELLRANDDAQTQLTEVDKKEPEQVEAYRAKASAHDGRSAHRSGG